MSSAVINQDLRRAQLARIVEGEVLNGPVGPEIDGLSDYGEWAPDGGRIVFFDDAEPLPRFLLCLRDQEGQASYDAFETFPEAHQAAGRYAGQGDADDVFAAALPERLVDLDAATATPVQLVTRVVLGAPVALDPPAA